MNNKQNAFKISIIILSLATSAIHAESPWYSKMLNFLINNGTYHTSTQIVTDKDAGKSETHNTLEGTVVTVVVATLVYKIVSPFLDQALPTIINTLPAVGPIADIQEQNKLKAEEAQLDKIIEQAEIKKKRLLVKKILSEKESDT